MKGLTNSGKLKKLAKLADENPLLGALLISKLDELSKAAVDNPEELREAMVKEGSASFIHPDAVIDSYEKIYEVVKL